MGRSGRQASPTIKDVGHNHRLISLASEFDRLSLGGQSLRAVDFGLSEKRQLEDESLTTIMLP